MTDFTISPKAENVWLESWLDLSPAEQKEMDHVEPDEQTSSRFFHYQDSVYDIADFMRDDRFPEWHAGYPLNAFAMLMIRLTDSGDTIDIGLLHCPKRTFASASVSDADAEFRGAKSPTISWLVPFYSMR
ncbi:hypothetical protein, partial [Klebsiella pneumoniae]